MSHHDEVVENNVKKELSVALIGTLAFLAIVLLVGVSAFLRPAGQHLDLKTLNAKTASTASATASTATATADNATTSSAPQTATASATVEARNASTAAAKQEIASKTGETPNIAAPVASATASDKTKEDKATGDNKAGEALYASTCKTCHEAGLAGAPKFGDKAAWKDRIAQGKDTLHKHAIEGFQGKAGMMPAKGGSQASDDDVKAAVDYMVAKAS